MSTDDKKAPSGRAADETPALRLVAEFHSGCASDPPPPASTAVDVIEAARLKAAEDERASAPPPLLGPRRTPGSPPRFDSVPGLVDAFVFWVLEQAPRAQPAIFQAVGLAFLGALTGRQFQTTTGARGNMFFLAIAGTGKGKDVAIGAARRLATAANCESYVAGNPGSFRGYQRYLVDHPARFFPLDELGKLMLAAQKSPTSPLRQMLDFLLQLYSGSVAAGELPAHRVAKDADSTPAVPQACTSLVGFATEEAWEALTPSAASDGWLPRFLLVEGDPDAPLERGAILDIPQRLISAAQRVVQDIPGHDYEIGGAARMSTGARPRVFTVPQDEEANDIDDDLRLVSDEWEREARRAGRPWLAELITRWRENALKLSMLRATSRWSVEEEADAPFIRAEDLLWGYATAEESIRRMARALADRVGANEHDLLTKKLRRAIANAAGPEGWAHRGVLRRVLGGGKFKTRDFDDGIHTLEDLGDIERVEAPAKSKTGAGRPSAAYRLTASGMSRLEG